MKNRINTILLIVLLFIIMLFYQKKLQNDSDKRLRGAILSEWEERKGIEDSIKNEMDSKRGNREFLMQQNYQRELEEMFTSKLSGLEEGISTFKENLESLVNSRLTEYEAKTLSFDQQSEARIKKLREFVDQQEVSIKELGSSFRKCLKSNGDSQQENLSQVQYLKKEIQKLIKKQVDLEKRINKYEVERSPQ